MTKSEALDMLRELQASNERLARDGRMREKSQPAQSESVKRVRLSNAEMHEMHALILKLAIGAIENDKD